MAIGAPDWTEQTVAFREASLRPWPAGDKGTGEARRCWARASTEEQRPVVPGEGIFPRWMDHTRRILHGRQAPSAPWAPALLNPKPSMSAKEERLACTWVGAGCGTVSAWVFTFATFPYDICFTLSFSGLFGLAGGGFSGACTTDRRRAALFGIIAGAVFGPISIRVVLNLIVKIGGAGP